jgi:hypothetical protein
MCVRLTLRSRCPEFKTERTAVVTLKPTTCQYFWEKKKKKLDILSGPGALDGGMSNSACHTSSVFIDLI